MKEKMTLKRAIIETVTEEPFAIGFLSFLLDYYFKSVPFFAITFLIIGSYCFSVKSKEGIINE